MGKERGKQPVKKLDTIEIAAKQRHLHLLGKVQGNQALTKTELDELAKYEKATMAARSGNGKNESKDDMLIRTQVEAARFAGVDTRTIRRWKTNGMPVTPEGWYIRQVLTVYKENEGRQVSDDRRRHEKADASLKETKDEIAKIELGVLRGEYVRADEIQRGNILKIVTVRRALVGLGRKLAPQLKGKEERAIRKMIDEEIRGIIAGFSREA
jgi:phage terminase Nu1 subunit (DNA packaging protein)